MGVQQIDSINDGACVSGSLTLSTSAVEAKVGTARVKGRRGVYIKNTSTIVQKWGFSSTTCVHPLTAETASADGKGGDIWIDVGDNQAVFIVAVSGTPTASVSELK